MKPDTTAVGIDKLHLTFPHYQYNYSPYATNGPNTLLKQPECHEVLISKLFPGLTTAHFRETKSNLKWYRTQYNLKTTKGTIASIYTNPTSYYGKRVLVQINGMAFSDSAFNPLRPFNLQLLAATTAELGGRVTAIDLTIDDSTTGISYAQILQQSAATDWSLHVHSPFLRVKKGKQVEPFPCGNSSIYYGKRGGSCGQILVYQKHLNPLQGIYTKENPLKFPWMRFELRLKGATATKHGMTFLKSIKEGTTGQVVSGLFKKYLQFIEPTHTRATNCPLQSWYVSMLARAEEFILPGTTPEPALQF